MRPLNVLFAAMILLVAGCDRPAEEGGDETMMYKGDTLNALTDADREAGWTLLFDGDNLDAWQGYQSDEIPSKWVIDDGAIYFDPEAEGSGGDIVTREAYGDFELRFEWKISECGNSGVIYRADDAEQYDTPWMTGPEYQILDNTCHPDAENGANRLAGANYDMNAPSQDVTRPAGEWNESRILVDSAYVEHWMNGTKLLDYELWSDEWNENVANSKWSEYPDYGTPREGHIALQDHGDGVWYRNIRIRRL